MFHPNVKILSLNLSYLLIDLPCSASVSDDEQLLLQQELVTGTAVDTGTPPPYCCLWR